jgi:hypothetical protein
MELPFSLFHHERAQSLLTCEHLYPLLWLKEP